MSFWNWLWSRLRAAFFVPEEQIEGPPSASPIEPAPVPLPEPKPVPAKKDNFPEALKRVLAHEGGFVDHPRDPGGATNLGVTIGTLSDWLGRKATKADVKALTKETVAPIYRKKYWDAIKGDDLPAGVDFATFDFAVNSGVSRASKYLQAVVGVEADGHIGPDTLAAVNRHTPKTVVRLLCARRMSFLKALSTFSVFGKGWTRRVSETEAYALSLIQ